MVPAEPSTSTVVPASISLSPAAATTHGILSCRAMIDVCEVGPPNSVTMARTDRASRPAVSAGARSAAARTEGSVKSGTPGSGCPVSSASMRARMSLRSVTRSAWRQLGRTFGTDTLGDILSGLFDPALIPCQLGVRRKHLGRSPGGVLRASDKPVGNGIRCVGDPLFFGFDRRLVGESRVSFRRHLDDDMACPDHGSVGDACYHSRAGDRLPRDRTLAQCHRILQNQMCDAAALAARALTSLTKRN